jgi:multidrug transporter EmrE-like cation transporter
MLISDGAIDWQNISLAITIGIFAYGFSIVLYVISAQNIGATRGQVLFSTAPVWGVILSYLLNHEPFLWEHVISIVLLLVAVVMTNLLSHSHLHTHAPLRHVHYHTHSDEHHHHLHEGGSELKSHSHFHTHDPLTHDHPHNPDLHHRHNHDGNG